ncbi:unannotated protein [freshwater metagenome]|uniref:Unannotated protein n=1 Tax=freshwater metagenome TaxID=449393 RepID=A0A6J7K058_9ZZZZ
MSSMSSAPEVTNLICFQAKSATSGTVKKRLTASPRARWKMLAPRTIVLSTSKKAAAVGSALTGSVGSGSGSASVTAAALASPATR